MKKYLFLVFISIIVISCQKESYDNEFEGDVVLFEKEYINYAWGYQHFGWIMDTAGIIKGFDQPGNWNFVDSLGCITGNDMAENLQKSGNTLFSVNTGEVKSFYPKAFESVYGKYTEPKSEMADFGTIVYSAYIYNQENRKFKRIVLYQYGDVSFTNTSEAAKQICSWMKNLESKIETERSSMFIPETKSIIYPKNLPTPRYSSR